jgi:uncharacterized protein (DUF1015 family)
MIIYPFQAVFPKKEFISSPDSFFGSVKMQYKDYRGTGFFQKCPQEGIYIYQLKSPEFERVGIVATVDIHEYLEGKIKRHEHTLAEKEQNQIHLLIKREAMIKPVLLMHEQIDELQKIIDDYMFQHEAKFKLEIEHSNILHTFYEIVEGEIIERIKEIFRDQVSHAYIADGHHRTSSTSLLFQRSKDDEESRYKKLLSAFFPTDQLTIADFNRTVSGLEELSPDQFIAKISKFFDIKILAKPRKPKAKHEITMAVMRNWYSLKWRGNILEMEREEEVILDTQLLDRYVLAEILGIEDARTDRRISYIEGPDGIEGIKKQMLKRGHTVAFCLHPVCIDELMSVVDQGNTMPPKSTWFEPRLKNGLIVKEI